MRGRGTAVRVVGNFRTFGFTGCVMLTYFVGGGAGAWLDALRQLAGRCIRELLGGTIGTNSRPGVEVVDGMFTVALDYDPLVFDGNARWLEIVVNGATLSPRQELMPIPSALFALTPAGPEGPQSPQGVQGPPGDPGPVGPTSGKRARISHRSQGKCNFPQETACVPHRQ